MPTESQSSRSSGETAAASNSEAPLIGKAVEITGLQGRPELMGVRAHRSRLMLQGVAKVKLFMSGEVLESSR